MQIITQRNKDQWLFLDSWETAVNLEVELPKLQIRCPFQKDLALTASLLATRWVFKLFFFKLPSIGSPKMLHYETWIFQETSWCFGCNPFILALTNQLLTQTMHCIILLCHQEKIKCVHMSVFHFFLLFSAYYYLLLKREILSPFVNT